MPQGAVETPFFSGARTQGPMGPPKSKKNNSKKAKSPPVRLELHKTGQKAKALPVRQ